MKKLFLFSVAALALGACSNDEVISENTTAQQPKEIAFSLFSQPNTRAAADTYQYAIDGTKFPEDLNMYVAAYKVEPTAENFFAGTQFIYNYEGSAAASSKKWGGKTAKYWPLSPCYINFLAYANVTGTAEFNSTTPASAAVITQLDNSTAQTDLMYAIGNGAVTQADGGNALTFPTQVAMAFKHAQAWVDFYVQASTTTEKAIQVNSITLNGAKYAGTYTITHTKYNAKTGQSVAGAWSGLNSVSTQDVVVPGWTAATLTTSPVQVGHGLMIVPDDTDAADWTSFTINYTLDDKTYNYTYTPASTNAAQATHYVYNITFQLHEIFVAATVVDWTDNATNVTIQ